MISLGCLLGNLNVFGVPRASLSNCSLVNSLGTVNIAPVENDDGYRFQAIEPLGTEKDLNDCCVFASLATAIELARHPGLPLITVDSQDIRKIRDSFICEFKSLINVCRTYIKSISFNEKALEKGKYVPVFEYSEPKTEEWNDDQKKTLCKYIRVLGKGNDVDALMQKLPEVTKTILDTRKADLEKRKADLEKRGFDFKQTEKELLNKAEKTSDGEDVKALQKDWELWKEDMNNLWHDLAFYSRPSASWRSDTEGLAIILIKQAGIMSHLCRCQLQEGKSNETYDPERWYEFAESEIERINTEGGVSQTLRVVLGMMPDPERNEEKLFCERFVINEYGPASNIPVGKIFEENPLHGNMLIELRRIWFWGNDKYCCEKGCSRKELNLLVYPHIKSEVNNGKQRWKTVGHQLTLTKGNCLVVYKGSNCERASQSFQVIVQDGKRNEAIEKDMEAILLQMKIGSPGAEGIEKFSVANVNYDREEVLKQWGQGKQKSVSPQQQPTPSIQQQFPDILRQSFESQKQQGEQLKQFLEILGRCERPLKEIWNRWFGKWSWCL